jgi:hypothetical protein
MRPWRDIFSTKAWDEIIQGTDSTAHISKFQALKAKFDSKVDTPGRKLRHLAALIQSYHAVPKTLFANLTPRIIHLDNIRQHAEDYLVNFRVDMAAAKTRVAEVWNNLTQKNEIKPAEKSKFTGHYMGGDPLQQSVDRNVLTLMRRAERKAAYLAELRRHYVSHSRDPQALLDLLTKPQRKTADATGLAPGVLMEQVDPWHRPVEVQFKDGKLVEAEEVGEPNGMSAEFAAWYHTIGQHNLPFFLWLEGRPVCTCDNKAEVSSTTTVHYPGAPSSAAIAAQYRLQLVYPRGTKLWMEELRDNGLTRVAHTNGYTCSSGKGVTDAAAYAWTGQELLIAQHNEGGLHHSSFNGGGLVKCAGMIKMAGGKITYASNNSGHYKPGKHLLANFLQAYHDRGVLDPNAKVLCCGLEQQFTGTASQFLAGWKQLKDRG